MGMLNINDINKLNDENKIMDKYIDDINMNFKNACCCSCCKFYMCHIE